MTALKWLVGAAAAVAVVLGGLYIAMAERVEVVVLHSVDREGEHETRLWVVDDGGFAWLRTGADNATWLPRLRGNPAVEVERQGVALPYTAVVIEDPATVARIDAATLEKYGWSESLLRAASSTGRPRVAIRLDPR